MKAYVFHFSAPREPTIGKHCEELKIAIEIPIVPPIGTMLRVTRKGKFLKVEDIHWDINQPEIIKIYTAEPEAGYQSYVEMIDAGWCAI